MALPSYDFLIGGASAPPSTGSYFPSENPYTGQPWALVGRGAPADVDRAVAAARAAFTSGPWPALSASERGRLLRRLGDLVAARADELADLDSTDNGKVLSDARAQVRYVADYVHYYAGIADKVQGQVIPSDHRGVVCYTQYEPKGVVAIITPFNSPLSLLVWKLAPALAAGCTVVVKPSEHTSVSTLAFVKLAAEAGFPPGVVNALSGPGVELGEALVSHPDVAHVGFTGGEVAGRRVAELAGRGLKSVTLELGGKSPNVVFDDADLDRALTGVAAGIFASAGQSCQAGSRLLVQRSIHDRFVERLVALARSLRLGDPRDPATQVGPIATRPQFEKVLRYLDVARSEGATAACGGKARGDLGAGLFVEPTVLTGVDNRMRIAQEEVFGPVLAVIPFDDAADAVRIANETIYGLAAGVWTRSLERALQLSGQVRAGTVWINGYRATSFTAPFGGYKRSGVGRESGTEAIHEYLETKCVWLSTGLDGPRR